MPTNYDQVPMPAWNPATQPYPEATPNQQYPGGTNYTPGSWGGTQIGPVDPYDPRVGNGALPPGIQGSQNRAYVGYVQPNQTASSQITGLLDSKNPYMQNAERRGLELSNKRGLLNSSIAAGNAQRSAIEAAAPIAMQDANTYSQQMRQNIDALNNRDLAMLNRRREGGGSNTAAAQLALQGQLQLQRERLAYEGEQGELQRQYGAAQQYSGYGQQLGLQNNQYSNQLNNAMTTGMFQAGVNSALSSQNYYQNAYLGAMNNPAIISNPQGFQNWLNYSQGPFNDLIGSYFDNAFGGY
jgi:hypothetical protein